MYLTKIFQSLLSITFLFSFLIFNVQQVQGQQQPHHQQGNQPELQIQPELPEVSDEDLEVFVDAVGKINTIHLASQQEMIQVIRENELSVEDFNRIMQMKQNPQTAIEIEDEELEKFEVVSEKIDEIEGKAEEKAEQAILETGLTLEEYQNIFMAVQQDPELMQKVQAMLENN